MEKHGVTFKDYACASANLAANMPVAEICNVLGIEEPLWAEVQDYFNNQMANLSHDDLAFYSTVFTNPKQGKFANVESAASGPEIALSKYPEWEDFIKMEEHVSAASKVGIDLDLDKEYNISIAEYSQLSNYWGDWYDEKIDVDNQTSEEIINDVPLTEEQVEAARVFNLHTELSEKWEKHFTDMYKEQSAGLSDDIDF